MDTVCLRAKFNRIDVHGWFGTSLQRADQRGRPLRQGWVFSKRMCVLSGIQFTIYFIELLVVEMKQIVSSDSNVILTRQICSQRSGMACKFAASARAWLAER